MRRKKGGSGAGRATTDSDVRAAAYVRMSTEHQQYSTDNQLAAIAQYAQRRGFEIVRSYADEGKSGLTLEGREALKRLLDDIEHGQNDFAHVLVYDVSRWGRFQDPDESASYEMRCRYAGVSVHYCAEQFENDGSPVSNIIKSIKRMMAGEYSRELSVKVHAGQTRLIQCGFRQGGTAGYGLRRLLIDDKGNHKQQLNSGERKSIQTDRVILCPGPVEEVETVKWIYNRFVMDKVGEQAIADELNQRGVIREPNQHWTRGTVHQILISEKYAGDNVWNRVSTKLKGPPVRNDPATWVRASNAFYPIIDRTLFDSACTIIDKRSQQFSDEDMLKALTPLLERHGYLSGLIIDEADNCPSSSVYTQRFGSLLRAYALVGFQPDRDYRYIEINRHLRAMHPIIIAETVGQIRSHGALVVIDPKTQLIWVNDEFTVSLVLSRCLTFTSGSRRWVIRFETTLCPDITLAARMDYENNLFLTTIYFLRLTCRLYKSDLQNKIGLDSIFIDRIAPSHYFKCHSAYCLGNLYRDRTHQSPYSRGFEHRVAAG